MLHFWQNTRLIFLGRNTPTLLISDVFTEVEAAGFETLCSKRTADANGDWRDVFCRFADTKLKPLRKKCCLLESKWKIKYDLLPLHCRTLRQVFTSLPIQAVPFSLSMWPPHCSYNGSNIKVKLGRISANWPVCRDLQVARSGIGKDWLDFGPNI